MFVNESDLNEQSFETARPNEPKLGRKHQWEALYKDCSFSPDPQNMVITTKQSKFSLSLGLKNKIFI
jgi:hypothetical protein